MGGRRYKSERDGTASASEVFQVGKYGPKLNPVGAQVVYRDHPYDVTGCFYREHGGAPGFMLEIRTFDRSERMEIPISQARVLLRYAG